MAPEDQLARETEGHRLLDSLRRLGDELGAPDPGGQAAPPPPWPPVSMRRDEDEAVLVGLRQGLARLAESRWQKGGEEQSGIRAVLDGAQLAARCELLAGQSRNLRRLLPTFAYLVMLPVAGEGEANRVASRAARLIEEDVREPALPA